MKTESTKKSISEIEALIEKRIAEEDEIYELDRWDRNEIREEIYKANGWRYDPFPEEDEDAEEEEEEEEEERIFYDHCGRRIYHYRSMAEQLAEIGMSEWDFM